MNRRKFLKALFCIPLLAVVPKMAVVDEPEPIENYTVDWRDSLPEGFIWPTSGPDFKWSHDKFFHPNEGLCELLREVDRDATYDLVNGTDNPECKFEGLRGYITTGKERLQQLDDYSKAPFMDIEECEVKSFLPDTVLTDDGFYFGSSSDAPFSSMIFDLSEKYRGCEIWVSHDDGSTWELFDNNSNKKVTGIKSLFEYAKSKLQKPTA